ncbi:hypothetical protein VL14_21150 [Cytobacillus firmus]|nr:hypothetical protein VL14_21150 [Cytobacillus firmus]
MVVDHINHDTLDNRKMNLRIVPHSVNSLNRKCEAKNNRSSGCLGVSWNTRKKKWCSNVTIKGKYKHLGYFDDLNKAAEVSRIAREEVLSKFN